ncbi:hypothetical protein ES695_02135 [Candidatus Atribacteria bacterium 1244-E10-H5-B2]|nr:MAG: hypothetical protein ES695_02135 [Candidatus Atribacteria bacterium 1244-E10-H5-B2]
MIKQYKDKKWLEKKYWEEELSTRAIQKICGVSNRTICKWLIKFNIPCRSRSKANHLGQANHCKLSQKAIEWMNGELLGDGSLRMISKYSALFAYTSKYKEYINYVSKILNFFGIKQGGKINKIYHKKYDTYSYHYVSHSYIELLPIYKKWYPNGKKIIPRDIKLTPLTLKQHYIGDGYLAYHRNRNTSIKLCTNGFPIEDIKFLVKKLAKLGLKVTGRPSDNTIGISAYSTKKFLNYIGKCPVNCYQYKFNYGVN